MEYQPGKQRTSGAWVKQNNSSITWSSLLFWRASTIFEVVSSDKEEMSDTASVLSLSVSKSLCYVCYVNVILTMSEYHCLGTYCLLLFLFNSAVLPGDWGCDTVQGCRRYNPHNIVRLGNTLPVTTGLPPSVFCI